jgi:hypothetical protein
MGSRSEKTEGEFNAEIILIARFSGLAKIGNQ